MAQGPTAGERWLLLIHQIPPKPDYFRVKVRRRLTRVGAVALKSSVYVLPRTEETLEDFQWLLREIVAEGGEATLCEAAFIEGTSDAAIEAMFGAARDADYAELAAAARLLADGDAGGARSPAALESEIGHLRRRLEEIAALDFFAARGRRAAEEALEAAEARLRPPLPGAWRDGAGDARDVGRGRIWVTRRDVHVDRIASAWLIRRFIDPRARFKFVPARGYRPEPEELRFDMYQGEYTHEGERCTFETLLDRFALDDPALRAIGEIVHDIDLKETTFGREETAGVAAMIAGITRSREEDEERIARGAALLDDLHAHFGRRARGRAAEAART